MSSTLNIQLLKRHQFYEQACLRVVLERNVPSHLKEAGEGGLHAAVLAKKVDVEPFKLERILRYLTSKNIFLESKSFYLNAMIMFLLSHQT